MKKTKMMLSFFMMAMAVAMISCSPEDGVDGINGIDGKMGPRGTQGPAGEDGTDGTDGTQGSAGEDGTDGTDGTDGSAKVTRYTFPATDFITKTYRKLVIPEIKSKTEMLESVWLVYIVDQDGDFFSYKQIPAVVGNTNYGVSQFWSSDVMTFQISVGSGKSFGYKNIEIVRIEATNMVTVPGDNKGSIVPDNLDVANYEEVAAYYNLN